MNKKLCLIVFGLILLVLPLAASSLASPPSNDNFADAEVIDPTSLPLTCIVNNTDATLQQDEPNYICQYSQKTVWYKITPTSDEVLLAKMEGSMIDDTVLRVFQQTGSDITGLASPTYCWTYCEECSAAWAPAATWVIFSVSAGETYYIQAGNSHYDGGELHLTVEVYQPPANDNFADATVIPGVPFISESLDLMAATEEIEEPIPSCFYGQPFGGTAWYTFTPSVDQSYVGNLMDPVWYWCFGVYTGDSLENLSQLVSHDWNPVLFHATAGTKYYIQVYNGGQWVYPAQFTLDIAPPPVADFYYWPSDPSVFDTIYFENYSYDPAGGNIESCSWDFGDGSTATDFYPTHQFAAEGDYTVQLTVTTEDGRTASTSKAVSVRTHDVAITKFVVPTAANSGQTRIITVGVNSKRYRETVQVQLFKSNPTGYQLVGTLEQSVPVRPANRTTNFNFTHTFTSGDAKIGKVTFKAIASIIDARDALPADNEAISLPVKVTR